MSLNQPTPSFARLLLLLAFLAPAEMTAREATVILKGETIYDNNLFSASDQEDGDTSFRIGPRLVLEESRGEFQWRFDYSPSFEYYLEHHELRELDHDADAMVSWQISPRTTLTVSDRFRRFGQEGRFNATTDAATGDNATLQDAGFRTQFLRNTAQAVLTHRPGARHEWSLTGNHSISERDSATAADQESFGAGSGYLYSITRATRVGANLSWNRQIQKRQSGDETDTDFINLSGRVIHAFDPTLQISLSAGPALVLSDELDLLTEATANRVPPARGGTVLDVRTCPSLPDGTPFFDSENTCEPLELFENVTASNVDFRGTVNSPFFVSTRGGFNERGLFNVARSGTVTGPIVDPPSTGGTELTFFADLSLTKSWENWLFAMGYRRRDDSSSSAFGVTSVSDSVYGRITWNASSRLLFNFGVTWTKRDQSQESVRLATTVRPGTIAIDSRACFFDPSRSLDNCQTAIMPRISGRQLEFSNVALTDGFQFRLFDNDFQSETTVLRLLARYRLGRRVTLFGVARWQTEEVSGGLVVNRSYDRFIVRAGLEYEFEKFLF